MVNTFQRSYDYDLKEQENRLIYRFKTYALAPFFWGIFIFSIFFTTILVTKFAVFLVDESSLFAFNIYDFFFAFIGFFLGFFVQFTIKLKKVFSK